MAALLIPQCPLIRDFPSLRAQLAQRRAHMWRASRTAYDPRSPASANLMQNLQSNVLSAACPHGFLRNELLRNELLQNELLQNEPPAKRTLRNELPCETNFKLGNLDTPQNEATKTEYAISPTQSP